MDYTEIFSKAIELKSHYSFDEIKKHIDTHNDFHCGDYDDWADNDWYLLTPTWVISYDKCYGYLCAEYPIALLSDYCPEKLKRLLVENGVLCTKLDEPMSCDEVKSTESIPSPSADSHETQRTASKISEN